MTSLCCLYSFLAALASLTVDGSYLVASAAPQAPRVPGNFIVSEQPRVNGEEQCEPGNRVPRRLTKKTIVSPSLDSSASAPALISIPTPPELPVSLACDPRGVDVLPRKRVRRVDNLDSFMNDDDVVVHSGREVIALLRTWVRQHWEEHAPDSAKDLSHLDKYAEQRAFVGQLDNTQRVGIMELIMRDASTDELTRQRVALSLKNGVVRGSYPKHLFKPEKKRNLFRHLMLTNHWGQWVFSLPRLENGSVVSDLDALEKYCQGWEVCKLLMKTASYSAKLLVDSHNVVYNTLALEICPMALEKDGLLRLHVHLVEHVRDEVADPAWLGACVG